jgi:hypothetical protein
MAAAGSQGESGPGGLSDSLLDQAAGGAKAYLRAINERLVGVTAPALSRMEALGGALPAHGEDPHDMLWLLDGPERHEPGDPRGRTRDSGGPCRRGLTDPLTSIPSTFEHRKNESVPS